MKGVQPSGLRFCVPAPAAYLFEMREHILGEIRRLTAANGGQPPGQKLFARETGISDHQWLGKMWARWGDALMEAGFQPNKWNGPLDKNRILSQIAAACLHYGRVPTKAELQLYRNVDPNLPSPAAIARHFGGRSDLIESLRQLAQTSPDNADLAGLLPLFAPKAPPTRAEKIVEGFVYLIQSGAFYKIGRSGDLERRVKEIRVAMPDKAALVHSIRTDDPSGIEAYWHRRFAEKRANGEWFKLSSLDVSAFKKRKFQ